MAAHRQSSPFMAVTGWLFEILIGAFIGAVLALFILLAVLWVMALVGTAW